MAVAARSVPDMPESDIEVVDARHPVVAPTWRSLEARWRPGLSCSWDWTETWLRHYGDMTRPHAVILRRDGQPLGVALLSEGGRRSRRPIAVRTLHLGCAGEPPGSSVATPYNRLLTSPGDIGALAAAVLRTARSRPAWDELRLEDLAPPDASAFLDTDPSFVVRTEPCPTRDLAVARGAGGVVAGLSSTLRYQLRRTLRDLPGTRGRMASSLQEARDMLAELVSLHQARWTAAGEPGAFANERSRAFHAELAERLYERGRLVVYRVRARRGTVGCILGFVEHRRMLMYQSGFADFDDPRIKCGYLTHAWCMQACAERGLVEYDLLAGNQEYKRRLTDRTRRSVWLKSTRRTARTVTLECLRSAREVLG
jgi:CelD/BcsL family acetyltransferase involved in cellulose biosynthesis